MDAMRSAAISTRICLGNKLCFEEINHDLQLAFRYTWVTSDSYGFARQCELQNLERQTRRR